MGEARECVGLPDLRFHKLSHTGNTLAAATGVSTKELMARMGHASLRAALSYQHATADRDQAICEALSRLATGDVTAAEHQGRAGTPLHAQGRHVRGLRAHSGHEDGSWSCPMQEHRPTPA